jgi:uncharacterized protein
MKSQIQSKPSLIGRKQELERLRHALSTPGPQLIAVYGRRRVGKTYLVRTFFDTRIVFELVGANKTSAKQQLKNFSQVLFSHGYAVGAPPSWSDAFLMLQQYLEQKLASGDKQVVFLDELPWLASRKSGFLEAFSYFWNSWGTRQQNLIVVICGSAAAWMMRKVLQDKGGLHNRVTLKLQVLPFTLKETEAFLAERAPGLNRRLILELYMALGGIPYYLGYVRAGQSAAQNIQAIVFDKAAPLAGEFNSLYASLFDDHERHVAVIRFLKKKQCGFTSNEIAAHTKLTRGGGLTRTLEELEQTGFIQHLPSFTGPKRGMTYKLVDPFTLFHLTWVEINGRPLDADRWTALHSTPAWHAWSGYAFEMACLQHVRQIKASLGIAGVFSESTSWRHVSTGPHDPGAQIDLLIDRKDQVINLCEIKFTNDPFTVSANYAKDLRNKESVFRKKTGTKKAIFITLISAQGLDANSHSLGLIANTVTADALFS